MLQSFVPELYRYKNFITVLAGLALFFLCASTGYANPKNERQGFSYKTRLGLDLDGDHIPETATIKQQGSVYQVNIHFTTGRPKLRLRTYVANDVAGLSFAVVDINNDANGDIVVTSATSIWPVAIWLNAGGTKFHKVSSRAYGLIGRYTGPQIKQKAVEVAAPVGVSDDQPQAEVSDSFSLFKESYNLAPFQSSQLLFELKLAQIPSRGPPTT